MISGRPAPPTARRPPGATRIKRLRDTLGQSAGVSELLVKNIARRGYMLAVARM